MHPTARWLQPSGSLAILILILGLLANAIPFTRDLPLARADDQVARDDGDGDPRCGTERWSVKVGTDADRFLVDLNNPFLASIRRLSSWPRPNSFPANNRIQPWETHVYVLNVTLTQYKRETDEDYHLVLRDDSGNTLIAEIPVPSCVGTSSPFRDYISNARAQFDARFTVTSSWHYTNTPVIVTGVGFFDYNHNQTGHAPNFIELHPVLDIQFPQP